jgi:hypothetical protein
MHGLNRLASVEESESVRLYLVALAWHATPPIFRASHSVSLIESREHVVIVGDAKQFAQIVLCP